VKRERRRGRRQKKEGHEKQMKCRSRSRWDRKTMKRREEGIYGVERE
jgi:hypothetical protein